MYSFTSLLILGSLAVQSVLSVPSNRVQERDAQILKRSVDTFIATESPIALAGVLCNIGASGSCVSGAGSGLVIASPSQSSPDCKINVHSRSG